MVGPLAASTSRAGHHEARQLSIRLRQSADVIERLFQFRRFNAWLPTYLQKARHFDITHTGFYSALPFLLMIVGEFGAAWIGDRTGKRALVCFVSLFMTGVFLWFAALAPGAVLAAWCLALSAGFWGGPFLRASVREVRRALGRNS